MLEDPDPASNTQPDVAVWLASGAPFDQRLETKRIDTHAASVFLNGESAWKIKRPVRYSYLDFSTVDRRGAALEAELALNRRTAPELYVAVRPIRRDAAGTLSIGGEGEVADWILEMRRFPDDALLEQLAGRGRLDDALLQSLADEIAALHASAETLVTDEGAARLSRIIAGNRVSMSAYPGILDREAAADLSARHSRLVDRHAGLLDARARGGRIRHGHGDLHLRNIAIVDGRPVPFDCLEFDTELATIDVLYDLAFLLMDLWDRGLRHEANIVFNRYFDLSATDEAGIALVPLFMSVRATIRAHVMAAQAGSGDDEAARRARHYLAMARGLVDDGEGRVVAIGGLSGTGKSTLARGLGGDIGGAPGARILRSDVLRKRLAGVRPEVHLPPSTYTKDASSAVYAELDRLAAQALATYHSVIADAVFGQPAERQVIERVALQAGRPFTGIWLALDEDARVARVESRGPDASDADSQVVRQQTRTVDQPDSDWLVIEADSGALAAVLEQVV